MKICSKCGVEKNIEEFIKSKKSQSGYGSWCLQCNRDSSKKWQQENKEKYLLASREWKKNHKEHNSFYNKNWKKNNISKVREWCNKNLERLRVNASNRRAKIKANGGRITLQQWNELKRFYGNMCLCCGRKEPEISLSLDHVFPISLGGEHNISNAQPLCVSCNCKKGKKHIDYRKHFFEVTE